MIYQMILRDDRTYRLDCDNDARPGDWPAALWLDVQPGVPLADVVSLLAKAQDAVAQAPEFSNGKAGES